MFNRATLQAAFDLLEYLQSKGFKCIIAGGCARDLFFGVKPKDVDIIVVSSTMVTLKDVLEEATLAFSMFFKYDPDDMSTDDRILGGFKLTTVNVDVILYNCQEVEEAIEAFDYNLNQFAIVGAHRGIEEAKVRFVGQDHWRCLVPVRKDASESRQSKMQQKYWDLVPIMQQFPPSVYEVPLGTSHGLL